MRVDSDTSRERRQHRDENLQPESSLPRLTEERPSRQERLPSFPFLKLLLENIAASYNVINHRQVIIGNDDGRTITRTFTQTKIDVSVVTVTSFPVCSNPGPVLQCPNARPAG